MINDFLIALLGLTLRVMLFTVSIDSSHEIHFSYDLIINWYFKINNAVSMNEYFGESLI